VTDLDIAGDSSAYIGINELDPAKVYKEPHDVTITNSTGINLDGSNQIATVAGDLLVRESSSDPDTQTIDPGTLNDGDSYSFQIILGSGKSGQVTDDVVIHLEDTDGSSVDIERTTTVEAKTSARLSYGRSSDIRVYNAVQDAEEDPQDNGSVEAIGANAADILGNGDTDIPYSDGSDMFVTYVGASSETRIYSPSGSDPGILTSKTRLSVGPWPPASLSGNMVMFADDGKNHIYGVDENGNTEQLTPGSYGNGAEGASGVADIDGDGKVELVFVDSSQQLRYLNQDNTVNKINNGDIGSNVSSGFGQPADFTGNGSPRVPFVDGSQNPALVDDAGNKETLNSSGVARKAAVAPVDIDDDGVLEFMFVGDSAGKIRWIDDVGGSNTVKGPLSVGGTEIVPDEDLGLNSGT